MRKLVELRYCCKETYTDREDQDGKAGGCGAHFSPQNIKNKPTHGKILMENQL